MVDYDYLGVSFFDHPKVNDDYDTTSISQSGAGISKREIEKARLAAYDRIKKNGVYVYFPKELLRQDFVIRTEKGGIWVNNVFYKRQKRIVPS